YNRALSAGEIAADMATPVGTSPPPPPPPADTTPPTVALTAPAAGATVSGTTSVTASASDDVGVVGVQFKLDGASLGPEDTSAPYAATWDTTGAANGAHTLTAVARDAAGNTAATGAVGVTVSNAAPSANQSSGVPVGQVYVGGERSVTGTAGAGTGAWKHLAVTYDGASLRLYVDGALARTVAQTGAMTPSTGPLRIGGNSIWPEWF